MARSIEQKNDGARHSNLSFLGRDLQEPNLENQAPICSSIPVLDFHGFSSTENQGHATLEKLHTACKNWGFFMVVNHGVDADMMRKLKCEIEEFFGLPMEEKLKYLVKEGDVEGLIPNPISPSQNNRKQDWSDRFYMITHPLPLRKSHLFPCLPPSLRQSLEAYVEELEKFAMKIASLMAEALTIEKGEMDELFESGMRSVRMTRYPPCPTPNDVIGISPHSDATLITILLQLNGVGGLEVNKCGSWIPIEIPPDAFLVNVGDLMEIVSNGEYKSAEHRVSVNSEKERMSVAVFYNPKMEGKVGPSKSLTSEANPAVFKTIGMKKYVDDYFAHNKPNGKSYLEKMRIAGGEDANTLAN